MPEAAARSSNQDARLKSSANGQINQRADQQSNSNTIAKDNDVKLTLRLLESPHLRPATTTANHGLTCVLTAKAGQAEAVRRIIIH